MARFGPFQLDTLTEELWKAGTRIRLQSQPFRILTLLISNPGELVTREDIRSALWSKGTSLGFDNSINASMNKLRAALEDSAQSPVYIETLARRGYRFMVPVEWIGKPQAETAVTASASWLEILRQTGKSWKWQVILTSLALGGLLAAILAAKVHFLS